MRHRGKEKKRHKNYSVILVDELFSRYEVTQACKSQVKHPHDAPLWELYSSVRGCTCFIAQRLLR